MNQIAKRTVIILLTILILYIILTKINTYDLINQLKNVNVIMIIISILIFIPITIIYAERYKQLIQHKYKISLKESIKLVMLGYSINAVTPSKMGDLSKAIILKKQLGLQTSSASVIIEKSFDFFAICFLSIFGLISLNKITEKTFPLLIIMVLVVLGFLILFIIRNRIPKIKKIKDVINFYQDLGKENSPITIALISIIIWILHMIQIYTILLSLGVQINIFIIVGLMPAAIIVGMIPLTMAGIGTRDAAMLFFLSEYLPKETIIAFGILFITRYIFPAIFGIPFLLMLSKKKS